MTKFLRVLVKFLVQQLRFFLLLVRMQLFWIPTLGTFQQLQFSHLLRFFIFPNAKWRPTLLHRTQPSPVCEQVAEILPPTPSPVSSYGYTPAQARVPRSTESSTTTYVSRPQEQGNPAPYSTLTPGTSACYSKTPQLCWPGDHDAEVHRLQHGTADHQALRFVWGKEDKCY